MPIILLLIVGVGKEGRTLTGPWGYLNRQNPLLDLSRGLLGLCCRTDPMAVDGVDGRRYRHSRQKREEGEEPMSKRKIQLGCGEWTGLRGTGRPNLSRDTEFSGAVEDSEKYILLVQLTTSMIGNLPG